MPRWTLSFGIGWARFIIFFQACDSFIPWGSILNLRMGIGHSCSDYFLCTIEKTDWRILPYTVYFYVIVWNLIIVGQVGLENVTVKVMFLFAFNCIHHVSSHFFTTFCLFCLVLWLFLLLFFFLYIRVHCCMYITLLVLINFLGLCLLLSVSDVLLCAWFGLLAYSAASYGAGVALSSVV